MTRPCGQERRGHLPPAGQADDPGELRAEVRRAAAALIDLGVGASDRVTIWSPNTWHWVVACLATHDAGGAVVPLNTRYKAKRSNASPRTPATSRSMPLREVGSLAGPKWVS
jgi:hypothetical protein